MGQVLGGSINRVVGRLTLMLPLVLIFSGTTLVSWKQAMSF